MADPIFLTLQAGEDFNLGPVDEKFPTQYVDVSGGNFFYIPNPNPDPRESTFQYVFHAGAPGYGHFLGYLPYFNEYQPYDVTITDGNGNVPPQHSPTAQPDTVRVQAGDAIFSLTQLTQNDNDPDGDLLYVKVVSPFHFEAAPGVVGSVSIFDNDPTTTPSGDAYFALSSSMEVSAFNSSTGAAVPYATLSLRYVVSDPYGNESAPVTATIKLGTAPGEATYQYGTNGDDIIDKSSSLISWLINGAGGNDTLRGGHANDTLNGALGNDLISGGDGNDTIIGGVGFDRVFGGAGNDTFVFSKGDLIDPKQAGGQLDQILDFHGAGISGISEQDFIRFQGMGHGSVALDHNLGGDPHVQIYNVFDGAGTYEGSLLIKMAGGVQPITASDFIFV